MSAPGISLAEVAATKAAGEAIHRDLRERPLHERQFRFLRYARRNYRDGVFYAAAATIATALGCARSTVQLDTQEIEARGLWEVIPHALASGHTANAIIFVPGTLLALRKMEAEAIDWRRASHVKTALEKLPDLVVNPTNRREDTQYPEDAKRLQSQHSTSVAISEITNTPSCARQRDKNDERRGDGVSDFEKSNDDDALRTPVTQGIAAECGTKTTATREKIPAGSGGLARIAALLVAEGVSPSQAHKIARNVDAVRIEANLALGAHVGKRNPGGYLAEAIRKDYAASAIKPGSEAALAREREKPTPPPMRTVDPLAIAPTEIAEAPVAVLVDDSKTPVESFSTPVLTVETSETTSALVDALSGPENAALRERAIMELDKQNAWMGASWKHEGAAFEGCVRGRMLKLVRDDTSRARKSSSESPESSEALQNQGISAVDLSVDPMSEIAGSSESGPAPIVSGDHPAVSVDLPAIPSAMIDGRQKPYAASVSSACKTPSGGSGDLLHRLDTSFFRSDHERRASRGGGLQRLAFVPLISSA